MAINVGELHKRYNSLELREKNILLKSGSDLIYAVNRLDKTLATPNELVDCSDYDNSNAVDISNAFRTLEKLFDTEYERERGPPITWDLEKLREEDTLEELDDMLTPDIKSL